MSAVNALWQQRYRDLSDQAPALDNPVIEALLSHRSVRQYLDTPLPAGTLETLLAAAQSASTSSNLQAWSLLAVQDPARKARLASLSNDQQHIRQAPLFLVWLADFSRAQRIADQQGLALEVPALLDSLLVAGLDAALAAQNAVVAAEALGLGTVYIGALRNNLQAVIEELELPPLVFPVFGLVVGYADPERPAAIKPRLPQSVVLHRERYTVDNDEAAQIGAYEEVAGAFSREQGQNTPPWSEQVLNRLKSIDALHGRERIAQTLRAQRLALR